MLLYKTVSINTIRLIMLLLPVVLLCASWIGHAAARSAEPYLLEQAELHFEQFMKDFNRNYANEHEKQARYEIFKDNLVKVNEMNEKSVHTVFGVTKFMDLAPEEFQKRFTNGQMPSPEEMAAIQCQSVTDKDVVDVDLPMYFTWFRREFPDFDDHGLCRSGYAFSAAANIAAQHVIQHADRVVLSKQQIVDCTTPKGCSDGNLLTAFSKLKELGGIEAEATYPYLEDDGFECRYNKSRMKTKIVDCRSYNFLKEHNLRVILFQHGPLSVAVRGSNFQFYRFGIMEDAFCDHGDINLPLLLLGWSDDISTPSWSLLNFWGTDWGEYGRVSLTRSPTSTACGMLNPYVSTAIVG